MPESEQVPSPTLRLSADEVRAYIEDTFRQWMRYSDGEAPVQHRFTFLYDDIVKVEPAVRHDPSTAGWPTQYFKITVVVEEGL